MFPLLPGSADCSQGVPVIGADAHHEVQVGCVGVPGCLGQESSSSLGMERLLGPVDRLAAA